MTAVEKGKAAINESDEATAAIQIFRNDPSNDNRDTLSNIQTSMATPPSTPEETQSAADAINGTNEPAKTLAEMAADCAAATLSAISITLASEPATDAEKAAKAVDLAQAAASIAGFTFEAAEKALVISGNSDPDAALSAATIFKDAAIAAREAAVLASEQDPPDVAGANAQADIALVNAKAVFDSTNTFFAEAEAAEALVNKWNPGSLSLKLTAGTEVELKPDLEYGGWKHISFTMQYNSDGYDINLHIYDRDSDSPNPLTIDNLTLFHPIGGQLEPGKKLSLGVADNPASDDTKGIYQPQISEFRLWDRIREIATIDAEKFHRKHGQEVGLFHLPLDRQESSESEFLLVSSDLTLQRVFPLINPAGVRERVILIYGDKVYSLLNNLNEVGIRPTLQLNTSAPGNYDLSLAEPSDNQGFVGEDRNNRIMVESYAASDKYPLDRFSPSNRQDVLDDQPPALQSQITEWNNNRNNNRILSNRENDTQLRISESYILDVHNQPGWRILDIGEQIFLARININDLRLRSTEERLVNEGQNIFFDRDRTLEVQYSTLGYQVKYEFIRLNTFTIADLSQRLFGGGIDALLSLESQNVEEPDFSHLADINSSKIVAPKYNTDGTLDNRLDFDGAFGLYFWEIFFHVPFLIANQLNGNQKFEDAQKWYHYIFNPTAQETTGTQLDNPNDRYWRFRPFRNVTAETLAELLSNEAALDAYRKDPFDPHAIARLRINAYQKAIVMKNIDNLLDWGDFLFSQDTRESINEAMPLYVLAFNLLGPRPKPKRLPQPDQIGDYRSITAVREEIPDFLTPEDRSGTTAAPAKIPFNPNTKIETTFCVIENEHFIGYWDRVEDRLLKSATV